MRRHLTAFSQTRYIQIKTHLNFSKHKHNPGNNKSDIQILYIHTYQLCIIKWEWILLSDTNIIPCNCQTIGCRKSRSPLATIQKQPKKIHQPSEYSIFVSPFEFGLHWSEPDLYTKTSCAKSRPVLTMILCILSKA